MIYIDKSYLSIWMIFMLLGVITTTTFTSAEFNIPQSNKDYNVLEVVPHSTSSFTQGLTYFNGHIYEGTGLEHESNLLQHDPADNMKTLKKIPVTPAHLFGEGITHYYIWKTDESGRRFKEHRLIQITWMNKVGLVYSLPDLNLIEKFNYETVTGEGWGITFVEHTNEFYVSDGSEYLIVWDVDTLKEKRRIAVTIDNRRNSVANVKQLNELEFVDFAPLQADSLRKVEEDQQCKKDDNDGSMKCVNALEISDFTSSMRILANIWYQDVIVSIDPISGSVTKVYDLSDIYPIKQRREDEADCLNGISITGEPSSDSGTRIWVTGKLWPSMYRLELLVNWS